MGRKPSIQLRNLLTFFASGKKQKELKVKAFRDDKCKQFIRNFILKKILREIDGDMMPEFISVRKQYKDCGEKNKAANIIRNWIATNKTLLVDIERVLKSQSCWEDYYLEVLELIYIGEVSQKNQIVEDLLKCQLELLAKEVRLKSQSSLKSDLICESSIESQEPSGELLEMLLDGFPEAFPKIYTIEDENSRFEAMEDSESIDFSGIDW